MSTIESMHQSANTVRDALDGDNKRSNSTPCSEQADFASLELPYCPPFGHHPSFECSYYPLSESCVRLPKKVDYGREGCCDSDESPLEQSYPSTPEQYYPSATSYSPLSEHSSSPNTPCSYSLPYRPSAIYTSPYLQVDNNEAFLKPIQFTDGKALSSRTDYFCAPVEVAGISGSPASLGVYKGGRSASASISPTSSFDDSIVPLYDAVAAPQVLSCDFTPSAANDCGASQSTASIPSLELCCATSTPQIDSTDVDPVVSLIYDALVPTQDISSVSTSSAATSLSVTQNMASNSFPGSDTVSAPRNMWTPQSAFSPLSSSIALRVIPIERPKLAPSRAINGVVSFPIVRPSCSLTLSLKPVSPWASISKKRSYKENKENIKPLAWL